MTLVHIDRSDDWPNGVDKTPTLSNIDNFVKLSEGQGSILYVENIFQSQARCPGHLHSHKSFSPPQSWL